MKDLRSIEYGGGFVSVQLKNGCMSRACNTVIAPRLRWSYFPIESIFMIECTSRACAL
jgi:hypothetical protein